MVGEDDATVIGAVLPCFVSLDGNNLLRYKYVLRFEMLFDDFIILATQYAFYWQNAYFLE